MSLRLDTLKSDTETIVLVNSVNGDLIPIYDIKGIKDYIGPDKCLNDYFSIEEINDFKNVYELEDEL